MFTTIIRQQLGRKVRCYSDWAVIAGRQRPDARWASPRNRIETKPIKHLEKSSKPRESQAKQATSLEIKPFPFEVNEKDKFHHSRRAFEPLHDKPYEERLQLKESACKDSLRSLGKKLIDQGTPIELDSTGLPCDVAPIVPATQLTRYRSSMEYRIWFGPDGKTKTVGTFVFPFGHYNNTVCVEPDKNHSLTENLIKSCDVLQDFIRNQSQLPLNYQRKNQGGWSSIKVESNRADELMVVGVVDNHQLKPEMIMKERDSFRDFMVSQCGKRGIKLASLYFQQRLGSDDNYSGLELIYGDAALEQQLGHLKYLSNPRTHISASGRPNFYKSIRETIEQCYKFKQRNVKPVILNPRCADGLLGLYLADMAQQVVGVDPSQSTIDNAKKNAALNGISNVDFVCSQLAEVLEGGIFDREEGQETLVVFDAIRDISKNIEAMKNCKRLDKLIYVSRNMIIGEKHANLMRLCGHSADAPSQQRLSPVLVVPVDTSPVTNFFHTITVLERRT